MPTRCLLDKVVVRYTLDGMVSLSLGRTLTDEQLAALELFQSSAPGQVELYLSPASANILRDCLKSPHRRVQGAVLPTIPLSNRPNRRR